MDRTPAEIIATSRCADRHRSRGAVPPEERRARRSAGTRNTPPERRSRLAHLCRQRHRAAGHGQRADHRGVGGGAGPRAALTGAPASVRDGASTILSCANDRSVRPWCCCRGRVALTGEDGDVHHGSQPVANGSVEPDGALVARPGVQERRLAALHHALRHEHGEEPPEAASLRVGMRAARRSPPRGRQASCARPPSR